MRANGRAVELPEGATLADLIEVLGLTSRSVAAAERNGEPVTRAQHASTPLVDGDRVELVRAVAGG